MMLFESPGAVSLNAVAKKSVQNPGFFIVSRVT